MHTTPDYLDELFGGGLDPIEVEAGLDSMKTAEAARLEALATAAASAAAARDAMRCPRCAGAGRLAHFTHRKGGECFLCGGSGVFAGYAA